MHFVGLLQNKDVTLMSIYAYLSVLNVKETSSTFTFNIKSVVTRDKPYTGIIDIENRYNLYV